jgi:hypothetical protein
MPKSTRPTREPKKQPTHTLKEKKAAKRAKKYEADHPPLIARNP